MSTSRWAEDEIVRIDYAYDRDRSSSGSSRYANYVAMHGKALRGDEYGDVPAPGEFAGEALRIATAPVMVPEFAKVRADVARLRAYTSQDMDGALVLEARVRLRHGDLAAKLPYAWGDWTRSSGGWDEDDDQAALVDPYRPGPAVLAEVVLRDTVPGFTCEVPASGVGDAELAVIAGDAVALLAQAVNGRLGPMVAALRRV